jgi:hypothetical protein
MYVNLSMTTFTSIVVAVRTQARLCERFFSATQQPRLPRAPRNTPFRRDTVFPAAATMQRRILPDKHPPRRPGSEPDVR